ncbi:hypothetical protein HK104_005934 [Borealophlyctis nickersoniae]|nr:hypothetical protein HK104_005934 [Borealophlyctis nickersoniae]
MSSTRERELEKRKQMHERAVKRINWIPRVLIFLTLGGIAVMCWQAYTTTVPKYKFCMVLEEDFNGGELNRNTWSFEQQLGGFGTGEFDWTTNSNQNVYVSNGQLHIVPTLTSDTLGEAAVMDGTTIDLTSDGSCTSTGANVTRQKDCVIRSDAKTGVILPPIRTGRITTKDSVAIRYGKVEVKAKMPQGDWLWPAIWLYPKNSTYGQWPASGEIDIAEVRGNAVSYPPGGRNTMVSAMHWGPVDTLDMFYKTQGFRRLRRGTFADSFHTFSLVWTPDSISTYVDDVLRTVYYYDFNQGGDLWDLGNFPAVYNNNSAVENPWKNGGKNAPFDQEFYLILNVAVGGTKNFFPDKIANKPWVNESPTAARDFWNARDQWLPTWPQGEGRGMSVDSVKMYKLC